jgi:hypothetical protein
MGSAKIGIAIPCHVNDQHFLSLCLSSISRLDPPPHKHLVNLNRGEGGLKRIRTELFDELFRTCDIVLQCDAEFYLLPNILSYVSAQKATSFSCLTRGVSDILKIIARFLSRHPWTGCYSLPKEVWQKVKASPEWDGTDTSVKRIAKNYQFVYTPKYYILRRSPKRIQVALSQKSLLGKIRYLMLRGI